MSDIIKKLKAHRGQIKSELTRFNTYLDKFDPTNKTLTQLETRLEATQDILCQFKRVQTDYEEALIAEGNFDEDEEEKERYDFENKYYDAISRGKDLIMQLNNNISSFSPNSQYKITNNLLSSSAKLPSLKLPDFSGSYMEWQQFHDTFSALVHDNINLQDIEKFYYLQGCLKGEAAQVIASLQISNANYSKAFQLLKDRYENHKAIINIHLKAIFDLPTLSKESHSNLRKFYDAFLRNFRALEALGEPVSSWNTILIYMLVSKLDFFSKREWENFSKDIKSPSLDEFTKFLNQRCQILEALDSKSGMNRRGNDNVKLFYSSEKQNVNLLCPFCNDKHFIYQCMKFKHLPTETRYTEVKKLKLCTNCLRKGHKSTECRSKGCRICNGKHNSLLHNNSGHFPQKSNDAPVTPNLKVNIVPNVSQSHNSDEIPHLQNNVTLNHYSQKDLDSYVLLSTALIRVYYSNEHEPIICRVLLDSGSQSNFISRSLIKKLNLHTSKIDVPVSGINQIKTNITEKTTIQFSSLDNKYKSKLSCFVIDKITDFSPHKTFDISHLNLPELPLADPSFNIASNVDILLGCSIFFDLLLTDQIRLGKNLPVLQNSLLGWIVAGNVPRMQQSKCFFLETQNIDLHSQIEKFWNIEEVSESKLNNLTTEEVQCELHFTENLSRNKEGRFVVKLPLKNNIHELGESESKALNSLYSLEKTLSKSSELKKEYSSFLTEYKELKHMKEIVKGDDKINFNYYMPHHCVLKPSSLTTKIRVVFNASSKTSTNLSLNDVLMDGPVLQNDLFSILLRFRKHEVVLIGDLTKMYRQILVHPDHVNLQRIVWRENPNDQVKHFALQTLTYGTKPASFIATRCLKQISIENNVEFPEECDIILKDMYMDDILTGCSNTSEMIKLRENLSRIFSSYGFEIRKFQSNFLQVLENLEQSSENQYIIADDASTKTLGVSWVSSLDVFRYKGQEFATVQKIATKRVILSFIAKVFDPLGLLGPILIRAKILMQRLWQLKVDWDEPIPDDISEQWHNLQVQISQVHTLEIPRKVLINYSTQIQIHAFSDASEKAYACTIYIRSVKNDGKICCHLLCAKSRVAPLKSISLPRLELCGALLLSRLLSKCIKVLDLNINQLFLYTDSTIVLSWLASEPKTWKTFVANRVSEIRQLTDVDNWYHVSSNENPADIISRGANLKDLSKSELWWHGPTFLNLPLEAWPQNTHISNFSRNPKNLLEFKQPIFTLICNNFEVEFDIFDRYSNFYTLIRVTAYCLRYIRSSKCKLKSYSLKPTFGSLSNSEINDSTNTLIKIVQSSHFSKELERLNNNKPISNKSHLKSLSPFLCPDGLLRVGGRLENSNLKYDNIHPIILPPKHSFTRLMIKYEHNRCLHAGVHTTLSHVRQKFWVIHGKNAVKSCLKKCLKCFRANPSNLSTKMGQLPSARVTPSYTFMNTAVDYAGPFELKDGKTRNKKIIKSYISVFVCLSTKAVHLELVSDLTSEGFLNVLKRFVSRRGLCSNLYSDNATNFVGANNELLSIQNIVNNSKFENYLTSIRINWHFIPARSPHFGGLWEAAVKSCKHHLKRVLNQTPLTYEEFSSILTQVEAVLNSRPLMPISSDPNDLEALTPGHFLIGRPLSALPQQALNETKINLVKRYCLTQQIFQHFWSRWLVEYLHNLQQRTKWQFEKDLELKLGSMVLIKENNVPPLCWPLGRIVELHPGADGCVRVVSVKTKTGTIKRAIVKLCLLPSEDLE